MALLKTRSETLKIPFVLFCFYLFIFINVCNAFGISKDVDANFKLSNTKRSPSIKKDLKVDEPLINKSGGPSEAQPNANNNDVAAVVNEKIASNAAAVHNQNSDAISSANNGAISIVEKTLEQHQAYAKDSEKNVQNLQNGDIGANHIAANNANNAIAMEKKVPIQITNVTERKTIVNSTVHKETTGAVSAIFPGEDESIHKERITFRDQLDMNLDDNYTTGFYFFLALSSGAIVFIVVKIYRLRLSRAERKYGVQGDRTTQELTPLPIGIEDANSDDEDQTLFELSRQQIRIL